MENIAVVDGATDAEQELVVGGWEIWGKKVYIKNITDFMNCH